MYYDFFQPHAWRQFLPSADLEEACDTERHLHSGTCMRARDEIMVTGVRPAPEFLDDLVG